MLEAGSVLNLIFSITGFVVWFAIFAGVFFLITAMIENTFMWLFCKEGYPTFEWFLVTHPTTATLCTYFLIVVPILCYGSTYFLFEQTDLRGLVFGISVGWGFVYSRLLRIYRAKKKAKSTSEKIE